MSTSVKHFLYVDDLKFTIYIGILLSFIALVYGFSRYYRKWTFGHKKIRINKISTRLSMLLKYGLFQEKVVMRRYEGVMHLSMSMGMMGLFIATLLRAIEYDFFMSFYQMKILVDFYYLVFKLMVNVSGVLVLIGVVLALIRRATGMTRDLPNNILDYLILIDLLVIIVTGFILDGVATLTYRMAWIDGWDPIGYLIAMALSSIHKNSLIQIYRLTWLIHMGLALGSISIIPYTKMSHIIVGGILNIFFARLEHPSAYKPVPEIYKIVEEGGELGALKLADTTWKERMDYDACVKCSRCHNVCPANLSGKSLSPMNFILKLRELMDKGLWDNRLVSEFIESEVIWACVTCGACLYECPMMIHHVESLIDIRRALFAEGELVPKEFLELSYNVMRTGNPYGFSPADKESWIMNLVDEGIVEIAKENEEYDYIYWMGCNVSYDIDIRKCGEALLKLLNKSGFRVAVLLEEQCCGEPSRRIGDELMFTEVVRTNGALLSKYRFKKILFSCPHCYNVFKHEYPQYGYSFSSEHYSQFLYNLVKSGVLRPSKILEMRVTYHDPCYLGRWNGIYEEPRYLIKSIPGVQFKEMKRSRENSFCCGGGGGHAFFEMKEGERISKIRMGEVESIGVDVLIAACPFCNTMLKSEAIDANVKVYDLSEVLARSILGE